MVHILTRIPLLIFIELYAFHKVNIYSILFKVMVMLFTFIMIYTYIMTCLGSGFLIGPLLCDVKNFQKTQENYYIYVSDCSMVENSLYGCLIYSFVVAFLSIVLYISYKLKNLDK